MTFLLTGATGFIGRVLVDLLTSKGHKVVILSGNRQKAGQLFYDRDVLILQHSGGSYVRLPEVLTNIQQSVNGIFHLAANQKYLGKKSLLFNDNVVFTQRLLEWAIQNQVKFFVYTSSIDAMGPAPSGNRLLNEEMPCKPLSVYGWSKRLAEEMVTRVGRTTSLKTVSLRLGNVYGPGSDFIVMDIARAIHQGRQNPLVKYYWQIKDRLVHPGYVDDIAKGIFNSAFASYPGGDVFLLSGDKPVAIGNLFMYIANLLEVPFSAPPLQRTLAPAVFVRSWYFRHIKKKADRVTYFTMGDWAASTTKAEKVLGFKPEVSLSEGISRTLKWGIENAPVSSPAGFSSQYSRV